MKKNISKISLALACIFLAFNASAQRPIWVVGHACNSEQCLIDALADGANGVEIDINSDPAHCRTDWSINHDSGYLSSTVRDSRNKSEGREGTKRKYVSLEEYLNFADMDKIAFLWLDIKTPEGENGIRLVEHIHDILNKRYHVYDEKGNFQHNRVPFSIFYNFYHQDQLTINFDGLPAYYWYNKNLWENEALGLGREGSTNYKYSTAELKDLRNNIFDRMLRERHMMTNGYGWPYGPPFSWRSNISESLIQARKWRDSGEYCMRTGTWTMERGWHGVQMTIAEDISYHHSWQSECDVILIECRNEFFPAQAGLPGFNCTSLKDFVDCFLKPNGSWSSYNQGRIRLARPLTDKYPDRCFR